MSKDAFKKWSAMGLRVILTGAILLTVAGLIVTDDKADVAEADADVYWFTPHEDKHTKFVEVVKDYGFNTPQTYNWNGVDLRVSVLQTEKSPREVLYEMQSLFVEKGINRDVFAKPPMAEDLGNPEASTTDQMLAAHAAAEFASGAMIPTADSADYAAMVGADTPGNAETFDEFLSQAGTAESSDDIFNATRFVEAFRNGTDRNTTVLAIWSDRNLEISQLTPTPRKQAHRALENIPVCMGCEVTSQVTGTGDQRGYLVMTLKSGETPAGALEFYRRALPNYGWQEDPTALVAQQALLQNGDSGGEQSATFRLDQKLLTVQAYWAEDGRSSRVSLFVSPN